MSPTHTPCYSDPKRQAEALAEKERYGRVRGGVHSCATGVFVVVKHRSNLVRLVKGCENKIY